MKPEPLRRSFMGNKIHPDFIEKDQDTYYLEQDIKSAVEWLMGELKETHNLCLISAKENIKNTIMRNTQIEKVNIIYNDMYAKLKEAFKDVMK